MMRDILYIFDMGGVVSLHTDVFPDVCRHLGITEKEFCSLAEDNLETLLNGEISTDEFWERFSSRYGKKVAEELFGKFFQYKPFRDGMAKADTGQPRFLSR